MKELIVISINVNSKYRTPIKLFLDQELGDFKISLISTMRELQCSLVNSINPLLINFDNGLIIDESILKQCHYRAYNYHNAPPDYPGRDVHHFAIYDEVKTYGVTLHKMAKAVDSGQILVVNRFDVSNIKSPQSLQDYSMEMAFKLFKNTILQLARFGSLPSESKLDNEVWGATKRSRSEMLEMCRLDPFMQTSEIEKRINAFSHPEYNNIYCILSGQKYLLVPCSE